ncbi:MAG TPA: beta-ketoacyl synthase, partial [Nitrospiraceae bacterium]|nr:beta-ketoacyl synthase [Nitrospiraceae bacterium]
KSAGIGADDVGFIAAHGTGTVYNDAMEMGAFRAVFTHAAMPLYSIKGGMGHTMGAAGLVETIIALRSLRERTVPPTINLEEADKDAVGWATSRCRAVDRHQAALLTNAGFSGVNAALILASG